MEPSAQPGVHQNVHVDGNGNTVIVVGRDFISYSSDASASQPLPNATVKTGRAKSSRRWLGAPAGVLTSLTAAILAVTAPQSPLHSRISLIPTSVWPDGKTALCRDGWYSQSHHRSGTCSSHGGVARWRFAANDPFWRG
jgi:uncharacterized protein DUF3761